MLVYLYALNVQCTIFVVELDFRQLVLQVRSRVWWDRAPVQIALMGIGVFLELLVAQEIAQSDISARPE